MALGGGSEVAIKYHGFSHNLALSSNNDMPTACSNSLTASFVFPRFTLIVRSPVFRANFKLIPISSRNSVSASVTAPIPLARAILSISLTASLYASGSGFRTPTAAEPRKMSKHVVMSPESLA